MPGFEPIPRASKPYCPTHCAMGTVPALVSQNIKIYGSTEIRNRTYCLRNFCPHRTTETIYLKMRIVGKNTLKKKEKRPN